MKQFLLLIFLSLALSVNAQFKNSFGLTESEFNTYITEILQTTGKRFELNETNKKGSATYFTYVNQDDKSDDLIISTYISSEGANLALEIKGVDKWNINKISGKYLSLFPIWQKYIDSNADKIKISENGLTSSLKNKFIKIYPNRNFDNFWSIDLDHRETYKDPPNAFGIE